MPYHRMQPSPFVGSLWSFSSTTALCHHIITSHHHTQSLHFMDLSYCQEIGLFTCHQCLTPKKHTRSSKIHIKTSPHPVPSHTAYPTQHSVKAPYQKPDNWSIGLCFMLLPHNKPTGNYDGNISHWDSSSILSLWLLYEVSAMNVPWQKCATNVILEQWMQRIFYLQHLHQKHMWRLWFFYHLLWLL